MGLVGLGFGGWGIPRATKLIKKVGVGSQSILETFLSTYDRLHWFFRMLRVPLIEGILLRAF